VKPDKTRYKEGFMTTLESFRMTALFAVILAFGAKTGRAKFHDSEEFDRLVTPYGSMKHLQRSHES